MAVYQTLTIKELSVDTLANTSRVQILWKSQQTGESHNDNTRTAKYWITINGTKTENTVSYTLPAKTTKTILNKTITVSHKENGTGSVSVQTWMDTRISAGEVELSKTLTLTKIPRASTVGAADAFVESTAIIAVNRKSEAYTHSLAFSFGDLTGYIDADGSITDAESKHSATNIPFAIPASFYAQMPDVKSHKCQLTCRTYQGQTQIGNPQTTNFTVSVKEDLCSPIVEGSVWDENPKTLALTGDRNVLVRYHSNACGEIHAQPRNGAAIRKCQINGLETPDVLQITNITTGDFLFSAEDSRGFTALQPVTKNLVPYVPITLNVKVTRTDPTSGKAMLEASGQCYLQNFGAKANELILKYRVNEEEEKTVGVSVNEDGLRYTATAEISGLAYMDSHTVTVTLEDALEKQVRVIPVKPGVPVFDWGEQDFAFHVPVSMFGKQITNLANPTQNKDAANKAYVDTKVSASLVWANDKSSSTFAAQTVPGVFSSTDVALIYFAEGTDAQARVPLIAEYGITCRVVGKYGDHITNRGAKVTAGGVNFTTGNRMLAYGEWSEANKVLIPVKIYKLTGFGDPEQAAHAICGMFLCGEMLVG